MRAFRYVALTNIVFGGLVVAGAALSIIGVIRLSGGFDQLLAALLALLVVLIGFTLAASGVAHLKRPGRATATVVAVNFAVVLWVTMTGAIKVVSETATVGLTFNTLSILAAYLAYRFILRPAAHRAFPANESETQPGTGANSGQR
jgi:hypothetical protein